MKFVVKTAHFIRHTCILRDMVKGALHSLGGLSAASLMRQADDALSDTGDCIYKVNDEVIVGRNIFDDIYAQCSEEDRKVVRISLTRGRVNRVYRFEAIVGVEPSMKVGALKSFLKELYGGFPEKNFQLIKDEERSLGNDSSTLHDCVMEEEEDSVLLACMGGSYPLTVYLYDPPEPNKEFVIPISSCYETVGELKKKIHKKTGKTPNDQVVVYQGEVLRNSDNTPLFVCGIVRQYMGFMPKMSKGVVMVTKKVFESLQALPPQEG